MMWVYEPWRAHEDNGVQIHDRVFATFEGARAAALGWGPMRMAVAAQGVPSATAQLRSCRPGEDVMISYGDLKDALAIYRVRSGRSARSAGTAFYTHWRDTLFPVLGSEIISSRGALVWYGWDPRPRTPAAPPRGGSGGSTGGGGGSSCLLVVLGLLLGLALRRTAGQASTLLPDLPEHGASGR
ncbi:hypothetical protein ACIQ9P_26535 [Kitasatospora sp. NPDC094019]|uniref:hypothetical protein n=1 Tax=Kitasatospora sp. NPDC094019 TaxID=3364091 RepID=UPI00381386DB